MIDWDFDIAVLSTWEGLSAVEVIPDVEPLPSPFEPDAPEAPWLQLGVLIRATDRQTFSLNVEVLDDFLRHRQYAPHSEEGYYEPLVGVPGYPDLWVAPWREPTVLVDAEWFDWPLVERLLHCPPAIRRRILWPCEHTPQELEALDMLASNYTLDDALQHAVRELEAALGTPLRIDTDNAGAAMKLVRDATFLRDPLALLTSRPGLFSPDGRRAFASSLEASREPF